MGILNECKRKYNSFFTNDKFDMEKAIKYFENHKDKEIRAKYIKQLYEFLFNTSDCHELTKRWIKSSNSIIYNIQEYNKDLKNKDKLNEKRGNAQVSYDISKYEKVLSTEYNNKKVNIFLITYYNGEFVQEYRDVCDKILNYARVSFSAKIYNTKDILVNIPAKALSLECDKDKFKEFLGILEPYNVKIRRNIQDKINSMNKEAGYFNYIMSTGAKLSATDLMFREKIESWLSGYNFNEQDNKAEQGEMIEGSEEESENLPSYDDMLMEIEMLKAELSDKDTKILEVQKEKDNIEKELDSFGEIIKECDNYKEIIIQTYEAVKRILVDNADMEGNELYDRTNKLRVLLHNKIENFRN